MREIIRTIRFKRDVKRAEKRGKDMTKLRDLILLLAGESPLPVGYKDPERTKSGCQVIQSILRSAP